MKCGRLIAAVGLVMLLAISATAAWPPVSTDGLVLYFGFDGMTTGDRGVKDGSNNEADGTIVRDVTMDFGVRGAAAKFGPRVPRPVTDPPFVTPTMPQGPPDQVNYNPDPWPKDWLNNYIWMLPSDIGNIPTGGFTNAVWVKAESKNGMADNDTHTIFGVVGYNPTSKWDYLMHMEIKDGNDGYRTTFRTDNMTQIVSKNPMKEPLDPSQNILCSPNVGKWTHLAWTYDRYAAPQPEVKFYINGVLRASYSSPTDVVLANLAGNWDWGVRIGAVPDNVRQFVGSMDELYIYNRALTAAEIETLAKSDGVLRTPETPLLGDANLDRVVDDTDASILGKNWQVASGATWFMGDFDLNGAVNDKDAAILAAHWGQSLPVGSVPEPSTVALLLGAVAALLVWRRRG